MRLHSASHSSMLCEVMITVCPALTYVLSVNILTYHTHTVSQGGGNAPAYSALHSSMLWDFKMKMCHTPCTQGPLIRIPQY